jgi:serine phosphatase RsbU (regulator of sigma subunit)
VRKRSSPQAEQASPNQFITVDSGLTALVLGDISGKGISAALLMASIQSALHAQLTLGANEALSTATLVARLG